MSDTVAEILLVEDSPTDRLLAERALHSTHVPNRLSWVSDGVEALRFLRREGPHLDAPRPNLVLLDLNLPRMRGQEVLAEMKSDPALRAIPVVVLTTSIAEQDAAQVYGLHANCLITKPVDFEHFERLVEKVAEFWLATVRQPPKD
jgi:chemotaxis family two-component system response regulator Rcp1